MNGFVLQLSLILPAAAAWADEADLRSATPPNVVLIFTDDQGVNDVGCYGSEIPTPHIDSLARDGLKFDRWYAAAAVCTPSRWGLLTGRNPSRSRDGLLFALMFMEEEDARRGIQPGETTIAAVLSEHGYDTALLGKWHLGHGRSELLPNSHGFDLFRGHTGGCVDYFTMTYGATPDWYHNRRHVDRSGYATELITDDAVEFLAGRKDSDRPFFLYLAYNAPHFGKGWDPKAKKPINIMQPQAKELRRVAEIKDKVRREFAAMTVALDDGVGRVLKALDDAGLARNTLVIFMSDHGGDPVYGGSNHPLRGGKATLFDGGLRVPCLMRWPGKVKPGTTTREVCSALDIFPSLLQLAGVDAADHASDGRDISGLMLAGRPLGPRELFWEMGPHRVLGRGKWTALRRGDWKLVEDASGVRYLFNLAADPNEQHNLAAAKQENLKELVKRRDELAAQFAPRDGDEAMD